MRDPQQILDDAREMFRRELDAFVPDQVFDAHFEIWDKQASIDGSVGVTIPTRFEDVRPGLEVLHPGRRFKAAFIPFSYEGDSVPATNEWASEQAGRSSRTCCTYFFTRPDDDPEWVRDQVRRLGAVGYKSYHTYSADKPTWQTDIPNYMPEPFVKVAHEEGWVINMHLVKSRAVADPSNVHWIRHYCKTYPNMKLVLSHSARGFQPENNLQGLPELVDLDNLFFDTSVNCEPTAHEAIMRIMGHERLLYGTDFPCSHVIGKYVALGDSFVTITEDNPVWQVAHSDLTPALVGMEHLRALKWACWSQRLSDSHVEDIFWNNAERVFGPFMRERSEVG